MFAMSVGYQILEEESISMLLPFGSMHKQFNVYFKELSRESQSRRRISIPEYLFIYPSVFGYCTGGNVNINTEYVLFGFSDQIICLDSVDLDLKRIEGKTQPVKTRDLIEIFLYHA